MLDSPANNEKYIRALRISQLASNSICVNHSELQSRVLDQLVTINVEPSDVLFDLLGFRIESSNNKKLTINSCQTAVMHRVLQF